MVQGPQDLPEMLKGAAAQAVGPTPAAKSRPNQSIPVPASIQAPDTVQLSQAAMQAAARARAMAKLVDGKGAQLAHVGNQALAPAVAAVNAAAVAAPRPQDRVAAVGFSPVPAPLESLAVAKAPAPATPVLSAAQAQSLQATPEVRPDRVAQAQIKLSNLSSDSSALDAKLAEKLLTEN